MERELLVFMELDRETVPSGKLWTRTRGTGGSKVNEDLAHLWRRIVFNMMDPNTDDHLRNHGFLREPNGWRLAPAYDLNPMPADVKPRIHALAIGESDGAASLETALRIVPMFGVTEESARAIATEAGTAIRRWRGAVARYGLTPDEAERMSSAFKHKDLNAATRANQVLMAGGGR